MSEAAAGYGRTRRALPPLTFRLPGGPAGQDVRTNRNGSIGPTRARSRGARPAGLAMYAAALALIVVNDRFRGIEAAIIRPLAALVTGRHGSVAAGSVVYFALGTPRAFGLQVTGECTSALLLVPLLVMMGSFATFARIALGRQLAALAIGATLIVGVNILRVSGIAWATWRFGYDPGYTLSHVFVGSAFSLVGFVAAMLIALWVLVRAERVPRSRVPASPGPGVTAGPAARRPQPGPGVSPRRSGSPRHARRPRPGTAMSFELDDPPRP